MKQTIIFISLLLLIIILGFEGLKTLANANYSQFSKDLLCIGKHIECERISK